MFTQYHVSNAIYCILGAPKSRLGGPNHRAPALAQAIFIRPATKSVKICLI